jgi:hypothetical protein
MSFACMKYVLNIRVSFMKSVRRHKSEVRYYIKLLFLLMGWDLAGNCWLSRSLMADLRNCVK